ncbi:alkaline phosphatase [Flavilitoribacter nigricans]|nr:alkaline phosphatase [Flavilitoribacter nigricans]
MPWSRTFAGYIFSLLIVLGCKPVPSSVVDASYTAPIQAKPKNVILMIGDGMGLGQISAGMYSNNNRLNLEQFPVVGFHKSHSASDLITDSAAGATAFACGVKTYNNAIGLTADTLPCYSILEEAEDRGLATGMVVTSQITNATPAAFIAHQPLRVMNENIAADFLETDIDIFIGGGLSYFIDRSFDKRNLRKELEDKDYLVYDYTQGSVHRVRMDLGKKFAFFTAENLPSGVNLGRNYLPYASQIAAQFLTQKSDEGFFLMIEGSQIDWAAHSNDAQWMIKEMLDFDRAIGQILEFAKKRGDTLVIVTADHETGGVAINDKSKMNRLRLDFTTNHHTAAMIPVFAYGPGARLFSGIYENTQIYHKMKEALEWDERAGVISEPEEGGRN